MKRLVLAAFCFLVMPCFALEKVDVYGGLTGGFYADALGYGGHLGSSIALDPHWAVGIESGLFSFSDTASHASRGANVEVSSRVIPVLLTGRYHFEKNSASNVSYYAGLSLGLALLKEDSKLSIGGVSTVSDSSTSSTIMVTGKFGMESHLLSEARLSGYAEIEMGVIRDIYIGKINAGLRFGF